jgi:hypothetical protein
MQVPSSRHRRALVALAALLLGLALPLMAMATATPVATGPSAATLPADVAADAEASAEVVLDHLAPMVTVPAVRATPVPAPVVVLMTILPAVLLAALAQLRTRRAMAWTLVRPDRVTAARRGSLSTAWRAPPPVR